MKHVRQQTMVLMAILGGVLVASATMPWAQAPASKPAEAPAATTATPAGDGGGGAPNAPTSRQSMPARSMRDGRPMPGPGGPGMRPGNAAPAGTQPVNPDMEVSIAFSKAEIASVLSFLSMASNIPIVLDAEVKGTVTIISVQKVPLTMAYEVINSALRVRGYAMVGTLNDKLIRVVPIKKMISDKVDVREGNDPGKLGTSDNIVTQVVAVQYTNATKLRDDIKPLVSDESANIIAVASTNNLIITDSEGNIKRLLEIIKLLDRDTSDTINIKIYQCKHANASALAATLERIFNITKPGTPTGPGNRGGGGEPPRGPDGNPLPPQPTGDGLISLRGELHVATDDRINALIISGSQNKIDNVLSVVQQLDVDTTPEVTSRVFALKHADVKLVASQLSKLFQQPSGSENMPPWMRGGDTARANGEYAGLKQNTIVADVRTNSVIVTATAQNMKQFEEMILALDKPGELGEVSHIYKLKFATASSLAQSLNNLFRSSGRGGGGFSFFDLFYGGSGGGGSDGDPIAALRNITVVPESKSNSLLITAPPQAFAMIEKMIEDLDQRTVQVFIEVAIVDVLLDDTNKFGVEWSLLSSARAPGSTTEREQTAGTDYGIRRSDKPDDQLGFRYSILSNNLQALLHALSQRSNVKVYSTPSITTADNVQASISIGQDEPYVSSTQVNGDDKTYSVDYKNASITLTVTPHVNTTTKLVTLDVRQEINELLGREETLNAPRVATRSARSTVMVNDGQTIVIGGIIKENVQKIRSSVPILGKIPLIGLAFQSRSTKVQKSELMVFLTPHILSTEESIDAVTDVTKERLTDTDRKSIKPIDVPSAPVTFKVPMPPSSGIAPAVNTTPVTPAAPVTTPAPEIEVDNGGDTPIE